MSSGDEKVARSYSLGYSELVDLCEVEWGYPNSGPETYELNGVEQDLVDFILSGGLTPDQNRVVNRAIFGLRGAIAEIEQLRARIEKIDGPFAWHNLTPEGREARWDRM